MSGIGSATMDYLSGLRRASVAGWNRFWFTPTDPATVSLIRILAGAMLLYTHAVWSLDLEGFFGANAPWLSREVVNAWFREGYNWSYFNWIDSRALLWTAHGAALVVFSLLTLGLFSRLMSALAFLATLAYAHRAPSALFGLDQINALLAMYLVVAPSGARYSLDRLLATRRGDAKPVAPSVSANIATRLTQLHMAIIYFFAGLSKVPGLPWQDGTALWYAFGNLEYQSLDMTWMAHHELFVNILTHLTVLWELTYAALVWPRWTRPLVIALAVPLHLGIALCMGMITFGLAMLIGNLAFVSPWLVRRLLERNANHATGAAAPASVAATATAGGAIHARQRRK